MNKNKSLTQCSQWLLLKEHCRSIKNTSLIDLFEQDNNRSKKFTLTTDDIYLDYSKNHITTTTIEKLISLAQTQQLNCHIQELFSHRGLSNHVLLRDKSTLEYKQTISALEKFVNQIHQGKLVGASGKKITNIVHIGVGGSYLGPVMVNFACIDEKQKNSIKLDYVYSMDGNDLSKVLQKLPPESSLFIIASKSFSTIDTMANADLALTWLQTNLTQENQLILSKHFIGISACADKMTKWGIAQDKQLLISSNTVGRYSLWSNMGLPIAIHLGLDKFKQLLAGACLMDEHFKNTDFSNNMPVILGLISVWNHNFLGFTNQTYLPYSANLQYLPHYLQQLMMESLGKSYTWNNEHANYLTGAVVFGEVGFAAQHSFFQLLHQGTSRIASDFIAISTPNITHSATNTAMQMQLLKQHKLTLANCFAQSRALMIGSRSNYSNPVNICERIKGNNPSTTILLHRLSPFSLGMLLALYEHKTFVESVIYTINPFSQDGVELGKKIANRLYAGNHDQDLDSSSRELLNRCNLH